MNENEVIIPSGNKGTPEEPYVIAYMCYTAYAEEVTATTAKLFPSVEAHRAGCPCGKHGSVEVAVHFVRFIKSQETKQKEEEKEQDRENLKGVVERIHKIKTMLPVSLPKIFGANDSEDIVDYWLRKHEYNPNGHALFWALDSLRKATDADSCSDDFWRAMVAAGQELSDKWSVEARTAQS